MMKNNILLFLMLVCSLAYGQMEQYDYQRALLGVNDQWHKLVLPNDLFSKVSPNLNDIRIFGITPQQDTIEAPYVLELTKEKQIQKMVPFDIINTSRNESGQYFTLAQPSAETINHIELSIKQSNFDCLLTLEGSQDQKEWFTITEDYRILSIQNSSTNYQFTKINFPAAQYPFFRIHINGKETIDLISAKLSMKEKTDGLYQNHEIKHFKIIEDKSNKTTKISVNLTSKLPVSHLQFDIKNDFDYYRPITIRYVVDSFQTQKNRWNYRYQNLSSGTLSSIENNAFSFKNTTIKKMEIIIKNQDNEPLQIGGIIVKGPIHQMLVRFTQEADYFLTYGNTQAQRPNYDINHFTNNIPTSLTELQLGSEQKIEKSVSTPVEPLFKNKAWLWGIMGIIIALLAWFSVKMIKEA